MAYDEALADRVRDVLAPRAEVSERKMFGGIAFMVGGNIGRVLSSPSARSAGTEADQDLAGWVEAGADFAASLPSK